MILLISILILSTVVLPSRIANLPRVHGYLLTLGPFARILVVSTISSLIAKPLESTVFVILVGSPLERNFTWLKPIFSIGRLYSVVSMEVERQALLFLI